MTPARPTADPFLPDAAYARELLRPWKLATFAVAMALLVWGALALEICDWDVGVSLLMGVLTYVCAPWSARTIWQAVRLRPRGAVLRILAALVVAWVVVDLSYFAYHTAAGSRMLRLANFKASLPLYLLAGIVWSGRGTLARLGTEWREAFRSAGP